MIIQRCSNCGKDNEYSEEEVEKVFPYSRETLLCKHCNRTLSVCSGFVDELEKGIFKRMDVDDNFLKEYYGKDKSKN
jgi:hypothetical protein